MRGIKFRGKSRDTGEFLYGDLMYYAGAAQIWVHTSDGTWNAIVIPETVGQYLEIKDAHGTEIYEGDIVRVQINDHWTGKPISTSNCQAVIENFKIGVRHGFREEMVHFGGFCETTFEVVGNIYDNPELLEGINNGG